LHISLGRPTKQPYGCIFEQPLDFDRAWTSAPSLIHQTETGPGGYDLLAKEHGF